jgi:hypothetical protein
MNFLDELLDEHGGVGNGQYALATSFGKKPLRRTTIFAAWLEIPYSSV